MHPPSKILYVTAKGDSAASNHYWALRDTIALDDVSDETTSVAVTLPDKSQISSVKRGKLPLKGLSNTATETRIFNDLNHSLISLGQLCDDDCKVILTKKKLIAYKNNQKILEGVRSTSGDKLWDIPIPLPSPKTPPISIPTPKSQQNSQSINIILRTDKKATDLAAYHHATMFSPTKHTLTQAIDRNFLLGWPGLTSKLI